MPAWMAQHVAAISGITGIDVDATTSLGAWLAARSGSLDQPYVLVRSIWVPLYGAESSRSRALIETLIERQPSQPPLVIAVTPCSLAIRDLARILQPISATSQPWRVGIGLPSSSLRGGRPHLVQLGALRRFAEEWDFALAVDLSGRFDPTWEAEAAIARLSDRLKVLRLRASAPARSAVGQDRVACRALHAAVDRGRSIDIAIVPTRPTPFPCTPRTAAIGARRAADYVAERAALHAEALREGIDHFEGSPSSRGM